jgi:seryl-tRNA(Sec) selenium transferase
LGSLSVGDLSQHTAGLITKVSRVVGLLQKSSFNVAVVIVTSTTAAIHAAVTQAAARRSDVIKEPNMCLRLIIVQSP